MSRFGRLGNKQAPKIERGRVYSFNEDGGFGEIMSINSNQKVFFDVTDTYLKEYHIPQPEELVLYEVLMADSNAPYAINVRGPENQEIGRSRSSINYKNYCITARSFQTQRVMTTINSSNRRPLSPNQNSYNINRSQRTTYNSSPRRDGPPPRRGGGGGGRYGDITNTNGPSERKRGTCKWFDSDKGFGFIQMDDGTGDIFVHQSALYCRGFRSLALEEIVEFEVQLQENNKRKAINVTGPGGVYCKGQPREPREPMRRGDFNDIAG